MENRSELVCDAVEELFAKRTKMTIIFGTQAISAFPATLVGIFLTASIWKTSSFHFNVRVLLTNLALATVINNCGMGVIAFYQLFVIFSFANGAELCKMMALGLRDCHYLRMVYNMGSLPSTVGVLFLAIERLIATLQFKTYEQSGRKAIGVVLVAIPWLISLAMQLGYSLNSNDKVLPYCQELLVSPEQSEYFIGLQLTAQLLGLIAFAVLVRINKRKMNRYHLSAAMMQLSTRYQLEENVKTTKLLIRICGTNCAIFVFSLVIVSVLTWSLPEPTMFTASGVHSIVVMSPWIELIVLAMPVFTVTFFCVCIFHSDAIRATMLRMIGRGDCGRSRRIAEAAAAETAEARNIYFRQLQDQWQAAEVRNGMSA